MSVYQDFLNNVELSYIYFISLSNEVRREHCNYIVICISKNKSMNGKLRINRN